ncbi:MAG: DUF952 domain-containing protein [candidate division FCPU426 bacterium]
MGNVIYHILTRSDLKESVKNNSYQPARYESDGFIHCAADPATSLQVLEDYFAGLAESREILILEIDVTRVKAEVKFEAPAPVAGLGPGHADKHVLFPHIYGLLNLDAVVGIGKAARTGDAFVWPETFEDPNQYF